MDIKISLLNRYLQEQIYMKVPKVVISHQSSMVCWLYKIFYGLKLSPCKWFKIINTFLATLKVVNLVLDGNIYYLKHGSQFFIFILYMDDILIVSSSILLLDKIKTQLHMCFLLLNLDDLHHILNLKTTPNYIQDWFHMSQQFYLIHKL